MLRFRKKILGLDIGKRSLKGVMLARKGGDIVLEDYFYFDLKETAGQSEPDVNKVLADLVQGAGLANSQVASAIEDGEVQVASLSVPNVPEGELGLVVRNELEAQLGEAAAEMSVDFAVNPAKSQDGLKVHAYYTKTAAVKERLATLESAGLRPVSLEGSMLASLEAARFNDYIPATGNYLLVDVGDSHTSFGLIVNGELAQMNNLRSGAGEINQALMQQFGCDFQHSELRKLSFHMEKEESAEGDAEAKAVEQGYYQIIVAIHDTVVYFKASRKAQSIDGILLAGGGLMHEGAAGVIEQSLGVPVTVMDPLRKVQIFGKTGGGDREQLPRVGNLLHVAVGLALRGVA